jgi:hypothetical protein
MKSFFLFPIALAMMSWSVLCAGSGAIIAQSGETPSGSRGVLQYLEPGVVEARKDAGEGSSGLDPRKVLRPFLYSKQEVQNWIGGIDTKYIGEQYDPVVGWRHHDSAYKHGVDDATVFYSYEKTRERRIVNYRNHPCRISSYGDSFTNCDQVSDGETWQEILAAHLGEPVRNFGTSGHSVYQAFIRMKREESLRPAG